MRKKKRYCMCKMDQEGGLVYNSNTIVIQFKLFIGLKNQSLDIF